MISSETESSDITIDWLIRSKSDSGSTGDKLNYSIRNTA